jgi:cyclophilin family peptidyl-prolyl cis-trans isomerase
VLAGIVLVTTVVMGLGAWGLNRVTNPPSADVSTGIRPCPKAPAGHPAAKPNRTFTAAPPMTLDPAMAYTATVCTEKGPIVIRLRTKEAPNAANNFVFLASQGFYDGLTFHRVCPNPVDSSCQGAPGTPLLIIQGGDPKGDGTGGPGYTIPDDPVVGTYTPGTLAMTAVSGQPNSGGSQFFIATGDDSFLSQLGSFPIFGEVTAGLDIARAIAKDDKILWAAVATGPLPAEAPSVPASPAASASPAAGESPSPVASEAATPPAPATSPT